MQEALHWQVREFASWNQMSENGNSRRSKMLVLGATASASCSEEEEILASSTVSQLWSRSTATTSLKSLVRT